jgi:hypothetical protein
MSVRFKAEASASPSRTRFTWYRIKSTCVTGVPPFGVDTLGAGSANAPGTSYVKSRNRRASPSVSSSSSSSSNRSSSATPKYAASSTAHKPFSRKRAILPAVPLYWYVLCTANGLTPDRSATRDTKNVCPLENNPVGNSATRATPDASPVDKFVAAAFGSARVR